MRTQKVITVVGCHAEGEIGDVIVGGVLPPAGDSVFEMMKTMRAEHDHIRKLLICEPRGSVARHVNLLVPSKRTDCVAGAIIMEPTEYAAMSGSNTICIATVLLEYGLVEMAEPETRFRLEMPGGVIDVSADCRDGKCRSVRFENVPAMALMLDVPVNLPDGNRISVDIAYGGMIFALLDVRQFGVEIAPDRARVLSDIGERIRLAAREQYPDVAHPDNPDIRGVSIVQFHEPFEGPGTVCRNTCIVAPGRSDRSPTGTGLSARLAVLHARGLAGVGDSLIHQSIIGSTFTGRIEREVQVGGASAIVPSIQGRAWTTGISHYFVDPSDPYPCGYIVEDTWGTSMITSQ